MIWPPTSEPERVVAVALDVLRRFFTLLGQDQIVRNGTVVTEKE
jgi:hypothetical protein